MDLGPDHAQQLLTEMVTVGRHVTQLQLERLERSMKSPLMETSQHQPAIHDGMG